MIGSGERKLTAFVQYDDENFSFNLYHSINIGQFSFFIGKECAFMYFQNVFLRILGISLCFFVSLYFVIDVSEILVQMTEASSTNICV